MDEKKMLNEEDLENVTGGEIESSNVVGYTKLNSKNTNNNAGNKLNDWNYVDVEITC